MADLPVRGVYLYFEELKRANELESFLAECDERKLAVGVSDVLFDVGERHFKKIARTFAAGPDCPACPKPSGL